MNFDELIKLKEEGKSILDPIPSKPRRFTERLYDVIAYRHVDGKPVEFGRRYSISRIAASYAKKKFKRSGCYRIDIIEVYSEVHDKPLEFTEKNYIEKYPSKFTPGVVTVSDQRAEADRIKNRDKNEKTFARLNKSVETRSDKYNILIFNKMSGNLVFNGPEEEATKFVLNNKIKISEHVFYIPNKEYERAMRNG